MSRATISITVLGVASLSVVLYLLQLSAKELTALGLPLVLLKSIVAFGTTIFALSARSYRQNLLLVQLFFLSLLLHFPGNLTFHWDE